jgi:uncharacterized membrane protein SpoIIM required for sporulation
MSCTINLDHPEFTQEMVQRGFTGAGMGVLSATVINTTVMSGFYFGAVYYAVQYLANAGLEKLECKFEHEKTVRIALSHFLGMVAAAAVTIALGVTLTVPTGIFFAVSTLALGLLVNFFDRPEGIC